ncbi:hypothetical protein [Mesorhizobium sp.]|uniref:hypothetical protein n=1 Tax=Mesorhizobium sp. TaxID=1871066 RepID=UPI0025BBE8A4|nr:hypothetical protein [Mesorhizobium sp.]
MTSIKRRQDLCRGAPRFEASRTEAATLAPDRTAGRLGMVEHHEMVTIMIALDSTPTSILAFSAPSSTERPLA